MQYKMQPDKLWKPETMDARSCGPGIDKSPPVQRSPHPTSVRRFRCIQRLFFDVYCQNMQNMTIKYITKNTQEPSAHLCHHLVHNKRLAFDS